MRKTEWQHNPLTLELKKNPKNLGTLSKNEARNTTLSQKKT